MELVKAHFGSPAQSRWPRPAPRRCAASSAWGALDFRNGRAMAGTAQTIPPVPDLPSPFPAMGTDGRLGPGLARARPALTGGRPARFAGSLYRRDLRGREKRGLGVGPTKRGKGTKITVIAAGNSLPLAVSVQAASPHESQLVEEALGHSFLNQWPERLMGDKAYDSDALDLHWATRYGIQLIAPHRARRKHPANIPRRMDVPCAAIAGAGKSNACLPGCTTSAAG